MIRRARLLLAVVPALVLGVAVACLDPTPVTVEPPVPESGPPPSDVAADSDAGADADAGLSCVACIRLPDKPGPGCADEYAACEANVKCKQALDCAFAAGCFDQGSLGGIIQCGLPCAADAGLSITDPAIALAQAVFDCAAGSCKAACIR